jgi:uncharacterized protein (DUF362 family)
MDRRYFLRLIAGACSLAALGCGKRGPSTAGGPPVPGAAKAPGAAEAFPGKIGKNRHNPHPVEGLDAVLSQGSDAGAMLKVGLHPYGGIEAFVHRGDTVVIKPNLAWARSPEQAANVQPAVLAAVIKACRDAGASDILIVEHPCDTPAASFELSGAQEVCKSLKVPLLAPSTESMFRKTPLSRGVNLHQDEISSHILDADCYINLACCKVHSASVVTLGLKNQMGAIRQPQNYHTTASQFEQSQNLHQNIVDLASGLRPTLVIIDAVRALVTNGPKGPGKVIQPKSLVISPDIVAADAVACGLMSIKPATVGHIARAAKLGLGRAEGLTIKRVQAA